jgi:hypothetical protein
VRAEAAIPLRARNKLHRPRRKFRQRNRTAGRLARNNLAARDGSDDRPKRVARIHLAHSTFHLAERSMSAPSVAPDLSERVTWRPYALLMCVGPNSYGLLTTL